MSLLSSEKQKENNNNNNNNSMMFTNVQIRSMLHFVQIEYKNGTDNTSSSSNSSSSIWWPCLVCDNIGQVQKVNKQLHICNNDELIKILLTYGFQYPNNQVILLLGNKKGIKKYSTNKQRCFINNIPNNNQQQQQQQPLQIKLMEDILFDILCEYQDTYLKDNTYYISAMKVAKTLLLNGCEDNDDDDDDSDDSSDNDDDNDENDNGPVKKKQKINNNNNNKKEEVLVVDKETNNNKEMVIKVTKKISNENDSIPMETTTVVTDTVISNNNQQSKELNNNKKKQCTSTTTTTTMEKDEKENKSNSVDYSTNNNRKLCDNNNNKTQRQQQQDDSSTNNINNDDNIHIITTAVDITTSSSSSVSNNCIESSKVTNNNEKDNNNNKVEKRNNDDDDDDDIDQTNVGSKKSNSTLPASNNKNKKSSLSNNDYNSESKEYNLSSPPQPRRSGRLQSLSKDDDGNNNNNNNNSTPLISKKSPPKQSNSANNKKKKTTPAKKKKKSLTSGDDESNNTNNEINFDMIYFNDVWKILEKGGYKFTTNNNNNINNSKKKSSSKKQQQEIITNYYRPGQDGIGYTNEINFRTDLCQYGVNCKCGSNKYYEIKCKCWTADEKFDIHMYVRYAIITIDPIPDMVIDITDQMAKELLYKIGFTYSDIYSGYLAPGATLDDPDGEGITRFYTDKELWTYLARYGLPKNSIFHNITQDELFSLQYYISKTKFAADITFNFSKNEPIENGRSRRRSTGSASSPCPTIISNCSKASKKAIASTVSVHSKSPPPQLRSNISTAMTTDSPKTRVSYAPFELDYDDMGVIEEFTGDDISKLNACLDKLKTSNKAYSPTVVANGQFDQNLQKVYSFLCGVFESKGAHGENEGDPPALYVCGQPGIGKTSGVTLCCNKAADNMRDEYTRPAICHINAAHLANSSNALSNVLGEIGRSLKSEISTNMSIRTMHQFLKRNEEDPKESVLVLVVDEIDALLSGGGGGVGPTVLKTIVGWANDTQLQVALIGISNCMNNEKTDQILDSGSFQDQVTFGAYSEAEIEKILKARVGELVFAPDVFQFIAKRTASQSGDVRKALEMATNAVMHKLRTTKTNEYTEGHIVKMINVVVSNKEDAFNLKDRLKGIPLTQKLILCVVVALTRKSTITLTVKTFKEIFYKCLHQGRVEDDDLPPEEFLVQLHTLVDIGVLKAYIDERQEQDFQFSNVAMSDLSKQKITLTKQLDEVERYTEKELQHQFFQTLIENAEKFSFQ